MLKTLIDSCGILLLNTLRNNYREILMLKINVHEAKINFSKLVTHVCNGNEIIITRSGREVARLLPVSQEPDKNNNNKTPGVNTS